MSEKWKPLQEAVLDADYTHPKYLKIVQIAMEQHNLTYEQACDKLRRYDDGCTYYRNHLYQVQVRPFFNEVWALHMVHINIRRIDGAAVFDWRHRQRIKNEIVGEECEAFEIYPAESRLSDESNKYHLWAITDPRVRIPVEVADGQRHVVTTEIKKPAGIRQRRY
jgi:hypothetical protein